MFSGDDPINGMHNVYFYQGKCDTQNYPDENRHPNIAVIIYRRRRVKTNAVIRRAIAVSVGRNDRHEENIRSNITSIALVNAIRVLKFSPSFKIKESSSHRHVNPHPYNNPSSMFPFIITQPLGCRIKLFGMYYYGSVSNSFAPTDIE